ncbi:MAG: hypothetical protein WC152_05780 [Candidatus Izemoplasmatales bacterium]
MSIIKSNGFIIEQMEALNSKYLLSNGYLGFTGIMDELNQSDFSHLKIADLTKTYGTDLNYISVFNPFYTTISYNGTVLHPNNILPISHEQSIDLETGLFSRTTVYNINDTDITIHSERFLSQSHRTNMFSKYIFFVSKNIDLEITHGYDLALSEKYKDVFEDISFRNDGDIYLQAKVKELGKSLNIVYGFEKNFRHKNRDKDVLHQETYILKAEVNRDYEIVKYAIINTDERKNLEYLVNVLRKIKKLSFEENLAINKKTWDKLWKSSRVEIYGNDLVDRFFQFNQFQLISHRPVKKQRIISSYGLTEHYIDTSYANEMYMFKYYLNNDYKSARRQLISRIYTLKEAQQKAQSLNRKGALYTDKENNLYVNALIVYNLVDYIERTMDKSILDVGGLEMILEISSFYMDYITLNDKKTNYQVLKVKSLDNQIKDIDNSALLNYLIRDCFGKTANMVALAKVDKRKKIEDYLKEKEYDILIDKLREARRKIYLQQPNVSNLIQYYDKYFKTEEEIAFPDILNLFYLFPDDFKELVKRNTYSYYRSKTNPSALGQFILSLIGVNYDNEREANKLFKSYLPLNVYDNASKYNSLQTYLDLGLSAAIYLYLVYGLASLNHNHYLLTADSLLPSDIRRMSFKIKVAKNVACVKIRRNSAVIDWNDQLQDEEEV